ncbi:aspartate aminotransferase family protein [Salinigranum sp.]|uniref:aspartate aminotransferase family protein n=1 Tax=Salinigranum sp. TaxID=1966351 RepID=UPI0035633C75
MARERDILERDAAVLSDAMKIRFFPFVMESQEGATLTGVEGDTLVDFTASWAVANTGYRHPLVRERVAAQLDRATANSVLSVPHEPVVALAERLRDLLDAEFETKVWFGHSGSEAGELISKALPAAGDGDTVVTFEGSYHGITAGAATISGHSALAGFDADTVVTLPFPNRYRARLDGVDEAALTKRALGSVESALRDHDVAGVVTEPLQSDGGLLVPPEGFLEGVSELCTEYGAYLVVDEVKAGLGRTGELFAHQHAGIEPDAVVVGKPLGSGLPISAVVGRADIVDFEPAGHMMTTAAAPLPVAAAHATLDVVEDEGLTERARRLGARLRASLTELAEESPVVGDVRGRGLMQGVELVSAEGHAPDSELAAKTCLWARKHGLAVFYVGMDSNVLELTPPLTISETELDRGCELLAAAIADARTKTLDPELLERYAGW